MALRKMLLLAALALSTHIALASGDEWRIVAAKGAVRTGGPNRPVMSPELPHTLVESAWVETGPDGSATIARSSNEARLHSGSRAAFHQPTDADHPPILQSLGTIDFTLTDRTLSVGTPYCVVGPAQSSKFTVQVANDETSVAVNVGTVVVTTFDGGRPTEVSAGAVAKVSYSGVTISKQ